MRPTRLLWAAVPAMLIAFLTANAQTLSLEQRTFILSKTYAAIPLHFAHWRGASFKPEHLDSVYREFLTRGLKTEDRKEFALLMREFVALLHNGHSWYHDNKVFGSTLPMGFSLAVIDGQWIVTRSVIDGVEIGDCVLRINERPVDNHYRELSKYFAASDTRAAQGSMIFTLAAVLPNSYTLDIEKKAGAIRSLTVDRKSLRNTPQAQKTESRWLEPDKVAYVKIPSFNKPAFENDALEQLKQYNNAAAIIVDVRGNTGGSTPSRLTAALMNRPYRWWTEGTPLTIGLFRYYSEARPTIELNEYFRNAQLTWQSYENKPTANGFPGVVIILVDRNTGSAAEDFVVPFKDNGRALIIGESTNGSTGQPFMYSFGDGISLGIGTKRAYMPDGSEFEGIGIKPNIEILVTRDDLYRGKDRVMERALAEAAKAR